MIVTNRSIGSFCNQRRMGGKEMSPPEHLEPESAAFFLPNFGDESTLSLYYTKIKNPTGVLCDRILW